MVLIPVSSLESLRKEQERFFKKAKRMMKTKKFQREIEEILGVNNG